MTDTEIPQEPDGPESEAASETVSEAVSEPTAPQLEVQAESQLEPQPAPKPKKKRSISTIDLYAGALLLAIVGGVGVGYTIQALRAPTPLPSLGVAQPAYPPSQVYAGVRPSALPAAQDDAAVVDGDLTKLLLPTPSGATVPSWADDHNWLDITSASLGYEDQVAQYKVFISRGVQRIADTEWQQGNVFVEIEILQYAPGQTDKPAQDEADAGYVTSLTMPDGVRALGREYKEGDGTNTDYAVAVHGSLEVDFWVNDSAAVPDPSIIDNLITQQMARL